MCVFPGAGMKNSFAQRSTSDISTYQQRKKSKGFGAVCVGVFLCVCVRVCECQMSNRCNICYTTSLTGFHKSNQKHQHTFLATSHTAFSLFFFFSFVLDMLRNKRCTCQTQNQWCCFFFGLLFHSSSIISFHATVIVFNDDSKNINKSLMTGESRHTDGNFKRVFYCKASA